MKVGTPVAFKLDHRTGQGRILTDDGPDKSIVAVTSWSGEPNPGYEPLASFWNTNLTDLTPVTPTPAAPTPATPTDTSAAPETTDTSAAPQVQ